MKTFFDCITKQPLNFRLLSFSLSESLYMMKDNRIATTLLKINMLGYTEDSTRHLTISRRTNKMTYTPKGKLTKTKWSEKRDCEVWMKEGRQEGKYGKTIRRILDEQVPKFKYTDKELEELVNRLKARYSNGEFRVVSGHEIAEQYRRSVSSDTSTLSGSCMQGNCSDYFQIYTQNPKVVKLIILEKDGALIGRALLWKDKYMDRIYGNDMTVQLFKDYAKEHNLFHKAVQSYNDKRNWVDTTNGEEFSETFIIELDTDCEKYPYIDTFSYGGDGWLSNDSEGDYTYNETNGTRGGEGDWDEIDECYINEDDAVYAIGRRGDEFRTHRDNCVWSNHHDQYIVDSYSVYCESDGDHYHESCIDEELVEIDYTYYRQDECFYCEWEERWYPHDEYSSEYLEELCMEVMSDNVEVAYTENGYIYIDGEWRVEDDLESEGYVLTDGQWVLAEE